MRTARPVRTTLAASAATAATLIAAAATAGAASAAEGRYADPHGDIAHGADIWNVRVSNDRPIRIRIKHDDLVPSYKSGSSAVVYLDTDRSHDGPEFAFMGGLFRGTDYRLVPTRGWKPVDAAEPLTCSYAMKLDYDRDVTHIRIGRGCLDRPESIRVAAKTGGDTGGSTVVDWLGGRRHLTPWLAIG